MKYLVPALALVAASVSVYAQAPFPAGDKEREASEVSVRGEVTNENGPFVRNDLAAELVSSLSRRPGDRVPIESGGRFEFTGVAPGEYELRITDLYGNVLARRYVNASEGLNYYTFRLSGPGKADLPHGAISARHLGHKPPKRAQKLAEKAQKAASKGDFQSAMEALAEAVRLDPEYFEARNNLGAAYLRADQFDKAVEQFREAVKIDPSVPIAQANLAVALMAAGQNEEAERAARRSLDLDGSSPRAHYVLALTILKQNKVTPELMKSLNQCVDAVPQSRLIRAEIFVRTGRVPEAKSEIEAYLARVKGPDRAKGEQMLAAINSMNSGADPAAADAQ